jgi:hypothetical protein
MSDLEQFARDLYAAAPAVRDAVRGGADPDPEVPTLWAGAVGRALAAALPSLPADQQAAAFAVVERAMADGTEHLRTVVATGLLEALASEVSGGRLDPALVASLLGPASRTYVDAWDDYSLGRSSLDPS